MPVPVDENTDGALTPYQRALAIGYLNKKKNNDVWREDNGNICMRDDQGIAIIQPPRYGSLNDTVAQLQDKIRTLVWSADNIDQLRSQLEAYVDARILLMQSQYSRTDELYQRLLKQRDQIINQRNLALKNRAVKEYADLNDELAVIVRKLRDDIHYSYENDLVVERPENVRIETPDKFEHRTKVMERYEKVKKSRKKRARRNLS